ncbi:MAG: EAL domain-containing protein [Burkholderiales bacterium]|nr:EAL domain-containing protein [Burkholderiales bacterium]
MPLPRPTSLRFALLCLVALAIIPAYALLGYSAFELRERIGHETLRNAEQLTGTVAREQERVFREARELSRILSGHPSIISPSKTRDCAEFLTGIHRTMPRYGNIGVAARDGDIHCSAVKLPSRVNVADRLYFRYAMETGQFAVGDYVKGRVTGRPAITVAHPVAGDGVVFIAIDLQWLNELLRNADLPEGSSVRVIDRDGTVLAAYPDDSATGRKLAETALARAIRAFDTSHDGSPKALVWTETGDTAHAVLPITTAARAPAFVWAELSNAPLNSEIENRFYRYLLWIGVATFLVFILAWTGSNVLILRAITAVASAARRFARGDLTARSGLRHAPAELAGLATTFDQMADGVESRERRITEISDELARTNRILRTLSASNRTLLRAVDEQTLLDDMCRVAVESGGFRAAWVGYKSDDESRSVRVMACAGLDQKFFDSLNISWGDNTQGRGVCGRAIRNGDIVTADRILVEPGTEPWWDIMRQHDIASAIALPLTDGPEIIGVMAIYAKEERAFVDKDFALLDELAADLSFGIATIRARNAHDRTEAALRHLALHDPGTGLPNQAQLRQWLEDALRQADTAHQPVALLAINLPRMREIGDILGRHSVNQCVGRIAEAIRGTVGDRALVAREGRFTLTVAHANLDVTGATALADRVIAAARQPFEIGACSMEVESWVGIAVYPGHATDPEALVGRASLAAQQAQNTGRPHALVDANPEEAALQRLTMLGELRRAIDNNELVVHYQPKVAAASGQIVGTEALVRWKHPTRGMIPPGEFIPIAEHAGLIIPMTHEILKIVGRQIHTWRQERGLSIPVAVNLSAHNLHDTTLSKHIDGLFGTWGIEPRLLQIEITESTLMRDPAEAMNILTGFTRAGMQVFIDDFGTGYSSLAYLASLPAHALKIDRAFVNNMDKDAQHRAIVHSILSLARSLGLKVVAEGVETEAQADALRALSCDELQGYLISRPLPPDQFIEWAQRNT